MLDSCQLPVGDGEGEMPALRNPAVRANAFSVKLTRVLRSGPSCGALVANQYHQLIAKDPLGFLAYMAIPNFSQFSPSDRGRWCALATTADSWLSNLHHRLLIFVGVLHLSFASNVPGDAMPLSLSPQAAACLRHVREAFRPSESSSDRLRAVVENDVHREVMVMTSGIV